MRLGLMYVNGLRAKTGRAIAARAPRGLDVRSLGSDRCRSVRGVRSAATTMRRCSRRRRSRRGFCNICAHEWTPFDSHRERCGSLSGRPAEPYASIEDLIARTGLRRDELATLAEIGALNSLGYDRRSAQWQIERAIRPAGDLLSGPNRARSQTAPVRDSTRQRATAGKPSPEPEPRAIERATASDHRCGRCRRPSG